MKLPFSTKYSLRFCLSLCLFCFTSFSYLQAADFITTWQTDNTGTSNDDQITIPGTGTYTVNWVEVGVPANNGTALATGSITITFPSAGTYQVSIPSGLTRINFNYTDDRRKILTIEQWGDMAWTTMEDAFEGCRFLTYNAVDDPDLSSVTSMDNMFRACNDFNGAIGTWTVGNVTSMSSLFSSAGTFNQNISTWDVSKVTDMSNMFSSAGDFNQPIGLWDVDTVTDMSSMFNFASSFNQDITAWDVMRVTNMSSMFGGAGNFDQAIGAWDVDSVTNMSNMFSSANDFNQAIGLWDVDSVTNMGSMFFYANSFDQDIGAWGVDKVSNMDAMFRGASAFDQDISAWKVNEVMGMNQMFYDASNFNQNIGIWNVAKVTNMGGMFRNATVFNQNIGGWLTGEVTTMVNMFNNADAFDQDISGWNVTKVEDMGGLFANTAEFNQNISGWTTTAADDMQDMFAGAILFNQDLSGWDFSNGPNMSNMFDGATAFNQNLGSWNITNISQMTNMLDNSGLSPENYESTLIGWAAQSATSGVTLGASGLDYCDSGETARNDLIATDTWSFVGDTKDCATFPVELLDFTAQAKGTNVQLNWRTASEINNDYFLIEKRLENEEFAPIGQVDGAGASNAAIDYDFEDRSPMAAVVYYRLQQVDFDGSAERSNIVEVHFDALGLARYATYPNPAHQSFTLKAITEIEQAHTYKMLDLSGKTVLAGSLAAGIGQTQINVESLPAGTYLLQVKNAKGQPVNLKLTVE